MNQADRERLDALAEAASGPGLFKKKETEWIKLNKYQEWVLSVKDKFTISAIVSALIADGVGLSRRTLFPVISGWVKGAAPTANANKSGCVPALASSESRSDIEVAGVNDTPKGLEDRIEISRQEEHEAQVNNRRPWQDPSLSPEERQRLQEEHLLQDDAEIWNRKV